MAFHRKEETVTLSPSRHAVYRKRKRENLPTRHRRTAAQLAALEAKPLAERTAEEKEAVRNHRKAQQRRERAAVTSLSVAAALPASITAPPPTRSASPPPRDASESSPAADTSLLPSTPTRDDSMLLNTANLDDILGRPLSPAAALRSSSSSSASAAQHVSPLHSPVYDTPLDTFSSLPAAACNAQPLPPAAASASAAAASAMSSGSKLRRSILRRRAAVNLNVHKRAAALVADQRLQMQGEQQLLICGAVDDIHCNEADAQAWAAAEKMYADSIIAATVKEVKKRRGDHCAGITPHRAFTIRGNVHNWAKAARRQSGCSGTEHSQQHASHGLCPGKFSPHTFFSPGVVEFAHWRAHKRNNDNSQLIRNRCKSDDIETFASWMDQNGRFMYICCHALETAQDKRT